ncbi:MAG: putative bifunctional diguanylate cyclase/phosphodiesterase, partial [Burkholderiales bacterium]
MAQAIESGMSFESAKTHADKQLAGEGKALVDIILSVYDKLAVNTLRLMQEIVARRQSNHALVESRTQLKAVIDSTSDMIWSVDSERFGLLMFNRELSDYILKEFDVSLSIGMQPGEVFPSAEVALEWRERYRQAIRAGSYSVEYKVFGSGRTFMLNFNLIERDGVTYGVSVFGKDITDSKRAQDEINNLAFYDPLTRLPNRRLLLDRLKQAMASGIRNKLYGALLFIDLDDFKTLNDTRGHVIGDLLLQQVAQRLGACVREDDTVARLGGDEFVVVLGDLDGNIHECATKAKTVAEKILATLSRIYQLDSRMHYNTASIGITLFAEQQASIDELLKWADLAMYQAKATGRNTLRFFDPEMQAVVTARAALEAELREAVLKNQFLLYYQPQVAGEKYLTGAEVLIRWQHP